MQAFEHGIDARGREFEAIDQGRVEFPLCGIGKITGVRLRQRRAPAIEDRGGTAQGVVALLSRAAGQDPGGRAGSAPQRANLRANLVHARRAVTGGI